MGERTEELCRVEGSSGLRETSMMGEETAKVSRWGGRA